VSACRRTSRYVTPPVASWTYGLYMSVLERVKRTTDAVAAAVEDVCVDHGGANVLMAEEILDGTDVVACLQQVSSEGVPKSMTTHVLDDARPGDRILHRPLDQGLVDMVPTFFAGTPVRRGRNRCPSRGGGDTPEVAARSHTAQYARSVRRL
jgi:hypothetical protein